MTQYFVSIHRPNTYDPLVSNDEAMSRDIDALNTEMNAAGAIVFVGGLRPTSQVKSLRAQATGDISISDGPYIAGPEYMDGFWVLKCANLDEAVAWGHKAALACRAFVEVRPFY